MDSQLRSHAVLSVSGVTRLTHAFVGASFFRSLEDTVRKLRAVLGDVTTLSLNNYESLLLAVPVADLKGYRFHLLAEKVDPANCSRFHCLCRGACMHIGNSREHDCMRSYHVESTPHVNDRRCLKMYLFAAQMSSLLTNCIRRLIDFFIQQSFASNAIADKT